MPTDDVENEIDCDALDTVNDWSTLVAALYRVSPACEARIEHVPGKSMVTVVPFVPLVVQTVVVWLANETDKLAPLVVPLMVNGVRLYA